MTSVSGEIGGETGPLFSLDQICGEPTGEGGDIPKFNLGQLCRLIIAVGREVGKKQRNLQGDPAHGILNPRRRALERQQKTLRRLGELLPEDFLKPESSPQG